MEYAQLNHDTDQHGNHGDHSVQDDHADVIDNSVDNNTADPGGDENVTQCQTVN